MSESDWALAYQKGIKSKIPTRCSTFFSIISTTFSFHKVWVAEVEQSILSWGNSKQQKLSTIFYVAVTQGAKNAIRNFLGNLQWTCQLRTTLT